MAETDFAEVTEMAGEEISSEQLFRLCNRYYWAASYCQNKDVIEVACGTGPGLGYLSDIATTVRSGDYSPTMVKYVKAHYMDHVHCEQFDAQNMPFDDSSADVILIFEALYYLPSAEAFVKECKRVLRPNGIVLVSNANPDLFDFNPSPHSFVYHGVTELRVLFAEFGFETEFLGSTPLDEISWKQKILRPIKKAIISSGLMPKSMAGKRLLKRLVFGQPVLMPSEVKEDMVEKETPTPITTIAANTDFKVIYCAAKLSSN